MKKGTKGMLIAAGAFAVAGIGLCIGGISVAAVETGVNVFDQAGQLLQDNGMILITYDKSFYEEVLAIDGVKELYSQIDTDTNGLASTLQKELGVNQ